MCKVGKSSQKFVRVVLENNVVYCMGMQTKVFDVSGFVCGIILHGKLHDKRFDSSFKWALYVFIISWKTSRGLLGKGVLLKKKGMLIGGYKH